MCVCVWFEIPGLSTTKSYTRNDDIELPGLLLDGIVYKVKRKQNLNIMHIGYHIFNVGLLWEFASHFRRELTYGYKQLSKSMIKTVSTKQNPTKAVYYIQRRHKKYKIHCFVQLIESYQNLSNLFQLICIYFWLSTFKWSKIQNYQLLVRSHDYNHDKMNYGFSISVALYDSRFFYFSCPLRFFPSIKFSLGKICKDCNP